MASLLKVLLWYCFTGITSWHFWKKQSTGLWRKILIFNDHFKKNVNNLSKVIRVTFLVHEYKAPYTSHLFSFYVQSRKFTGAATKKMYLANQLCLQVWRVVVLTISCKKKTVVLCSQRNYWIYRIKYTNKLIEGIFGIIHIVKIYILTDIVIKLTC